MENMKMKHNITEKMDFDARCSAMRLNNLFINEIIDEISGYFGYLSTEEVHRCVRMTVTNRVHFNVVGSIHRNLIWELHNS